MTLTKITEGVWESTNINGRFNAKVTYSVMPRGYIGTLEDRGRNPDDPKLEIKLINVGIFPSKKKCCQASETLIGQSSQDCQPSQRSSGVNDTNNDAAWPS